MSVQYMQQLEGAVSAARQRLDATPPLTVAELQVSKGAMLDLAAALQGCSADELLVEGGDEPEQRMGSTCCKILLEMLETCQQLDAPFFAFGAGYWSEVLAATAHGIRAGGVEIVDCRAATLENMLSELRPEPELLQHLFREAVDLTEKPAGRMFEFIKKKVVIKMNDMVFTPELRNRVVAEFAFCPVGSVLFAATNYGSAADDRLTP